MRLEYLTLPVDPVTKAADIIQTRLATAVDISPTPQPLNASVLYGIDAVFADAINGKGGPESSIGAENYPAIRIFYSNLQGDAQNESFVTVAWDVQLWLYFIYYVGEYSTQFQQLREQHIRANLNYLKRNVFPDNIGIQTDQWWKWNDQIVTEDHDTPLKYIDSSIIIRPPYAVSRVDISIKVHNYQYTNT